MIFGSFPKSHVLFGSKGQNGLETSSCCTVWREQDLPRGGWRQTQKSRTVWRELFLQIWRRTVWRGVYYLHGVREKVLGALAPSALLGTSCCTLWRQVVCWAPLAKLLVERNTCFSGLRRRVQQVFVLDKTLRNLPSESTRFSGFRKRVQ